MSHLDLRCVHAAGGSGHTNHKGTVLRLGELYVQQAVTLHHVVLVC
jgi:hypothetical protein